MLTKQVFALLALGAELRADRTFPHPHHYTIQLPGMEPAELTVDDVIGLLATKRIEAPRAAEVGDHYAYRIVDPVWVKSQALEDYKVGFGRCPVCSAFPLALTSRSVAPRHGHTIGTEALPPCAGSGQPLVQVVSREPLAVAA